MAESGNLPLQITPAARQDLRALLRWSRASFGNDAAARYLALLGQAFRDLEADPRRHGSRARPELEAAARTYHIALSRNRVAGKRVQRPRHLILYRVTDTAVEVGRILHDSSDLTLHLPDDYRA